MKDAYQNEFQKEKKMLSLLFAICMIWFVGKFFVFGLRASWGIMKLLCTVIFFPVILIGMVNKVDCEVSDMLKNVLIVVDDIEKSIEFYKDLFGLQVILQNEENVILSEGLVLQDAGLWGKTLDEISTPFNNRMELYFEEFDIDGLLAKYESGKYFVRYATELTEIAGGQKLVRLYDPSGNLIEVRTPFMSN